MSTKKKTDHSPSLPDSWQSDMEAMLRFRKKHFKVTVLPEHHPIEEGHVCLSTTNNGHQWSSIGLLKDEIPKVIEALQKALKSK